MSPKKAQAIKRMIPITHVLQSTSIDECAQCDLKLVMLRNRKIFGHSHASEGAASTRGSTMWKNEKFFLSEKKRVNQYFSK